MIPALLGKKVGMTRIFDEDGTAIPVTVVEAGPCTVLQVKTADGKDGYHAVQLGLDDVKPHRSTLPAIGHARKAQSSPKRFIREIRLEGPVEQEIGDTVTVELFQEAEVKWVDVIGLTKGRGFQGVMKRHQFGGQQASHGVERKHRSPGSICGRGTDLGGGRPKKGIRMAGRMGGKRKTVRNQKLVGCDPEHNLLLVRGPVPGPKGSYVIVRKAIAKRTA